jgi:DNA-directed RNA polymerase alpha subunit
MSASKFLVLISIYLLAPQSHAEADRTPIETLGLKPNLTRRLVLTGITFVEQLTSLTEREALSKIHGPRAKANVKAALLKKRKRFADGQLLKLSITPRTRTILQQFGVTSIAQLCAMSEQDILGRPNAGEKVLNEIKAALLEKGLYLFNSDPRYTPLSPMAVNVLLHELGGIGALTKLTKKQLLAKPNVGRALFKEYKLALAERGLSFANCEETLGRSRARAR